MGIVSNVSVPISREIRECIQNCRDCHAICMETLAYCARLGGRFSEPEHLRLLLDCAEICATGAGFMLRGSPLHERVCGVCEEVCRTCADDCARMGDDQQLRACADACRRCAESCHRMTTAQT
ncbi:MAG: four-helix bundle copper-binding protein [Bryobacteraceae bacterium]